MILLWHKVKMSTRFAGPDMMTMSPTKKPESAMKRKFFLATYVDKWDGIWYSDYGIER